jgi:2'-5' RNA ligase
MKSLYMSAFEPPIVLADEIRILQQTFANLYGSGAALKPPVHITFSPPIHLDNEQLLIYKTNLRSVAAKTIPFEVELDSFDFFKKNRVVFIRVLANQALQEMYKAFLILMGSNLNQRYSPHFTIGYRKIEEDTFEKIIEDYTVRTFKAHFTISKLNVWKHENGSWKTIESMPFHIEQ